jgi:magnesium-transporting ATPase (P-type)
LLFFYKNVLYTFPQFIFGFFSYFSGLSLFDDWYLTMYNLLFTSFTVTYVGSYDVDISYWQILKSNSPGWFTKFRRKFKGNKKAVEKAQPLN